MAVVKLKVIFMDGEECEVTTTSRAWVATERYYEGITPKNRMEASHHLAWAELSKAGKTTDDFEAWLDKVADVDEIEDEPALPTNEAPSPVGSSD